MKKLAILLLLLMSSLSNAQHCPFDGAAIIVVKIHERGNENTIQNLKLTLIKKKKNKVIKTIENFPNNSYSFPFLSDEYSLIVGSAFDVENWYLKIESVCEYGDNGWTYFKTTEIKLNENDKYQLCDNFNSSEYGVVTNSEGRVYKPVEVILERETCPEIN